MTMNPAERKIIVCRQFEKAHCFLAQADEMYSMKHWDLAANRYYYACYHAVQGLFISDEVSSHTHSGMISLFGLHYVKTGKVDLSCGSFLSRMVQLRQKADYNCMYDVSENDVKDFVQLARNFICRMESLVKQNLENSALEE